MSELVRQDTPPELGDLAQKLKSNLLPPKSKEEYVNTYEKFIKWQEANNTSSFSENILLVYFQEIIDKYKPSTLWSRYSMLKKTICNNHNVDISKYSNLISLLKNATTGYHTKKSSILTNNHIEEFINNAPDSIYLATKAVLIFGVCGACRREDLVEITVDDVKLFKKDNEEILLVTLPTTKTYKIRNFSITEKFKEVVLTYMKLRPINCKTQRFFINYRNGKCTNQPIGINKIGGMPKQIAEFLKLPDAKNYTGHCFRRSSATLLADSGADMTTLKRHGGWKSSSVAEGYIEDSVNNKIKIASAIQKSIHINENKPSTSYADQHPTPQDEFSQVQDNYSQVQDNFSQVQDESEPLIKKSRPASKSINFSGSISSQTNNNSNCSLAQTFSSQQVSQKINLPSKSVKFPAENFSFNLSNCNVTFNIKN